MKKGQITLIEFSLIALLLGSFIIYFHDSKPISSGTYYKENIDTFLSSMTKEDSFRKIISLENLSNNSITQNWSTIKSEIIETHPNFELILSNQTHSKIIHTCNSTNGKLFTQSLISNYNLTLFEAKLITFGVCY